MQVRLKIRSMLIRLALFLTLIFTAAVSFVQVGAGETFPLILLYPFIVILVSAELYGMAFAYLISVFVSAYAIGLTKMGLDARAAALIAVNFNVAPLMVWFFGKKYNFQKERSQKKISESRRDYEGLLRQEEAIKAQNHDLERQVLELARLYEATKAMSSPLDFGEIFRALKGIIQKIFEFRLARLITVKQQGGPQEAEIDKVYLIRRDGGLKDIDEKKFLRLSSESSEVLKEAIFKDRQNSPEGQEEYIVRPDEIDTRILACYNSSEGGRFVLPEDLRSFAAAPLLCRGRLIGFLAAEGLPGEQRDRFMIVAGQFGLELERVKLYEQVQQLAIIDGLTGSYVRRYLLERCQDELRRSIKHKLDLSCLIADIDHFKICNDKFGHLVGDAVLKEMAGVFKENVREVDFIGRYGGEEFCIILPDTPRAGAVHVAERLRRAVEQRIFKAYDEKIKVTVSLGTATFPEDASEMEQLIDRADQAMYEAKAEGRNRVCAWDAGRGT